MNKPITHRFCILLICFVLVQLSTIRSVKAEDKIQWYKVVAPSTLLLIEEKNIELIDDYGSFSL